MLSRQAFEDPAPKIRSFDSVTSHSNQTSLDDFLKTEKFLDYLRIICKYIPAYLASRLEIKSQIDGTELCHLTYNGLIRHLKSLRVEHIQRWCRPIVQRLMIHPKNSNLFNEPVDVYALEIPQYLEKIARPMDLGTVRSQLQRGLYESVANCLGDVALVFQNALDFNPPDHYIHENAALIAADLDGEIKQLDEKCAREVPSSIPSCPTLSLLCCHGIV